jgi:hypothetical protein
VRGYEPRLVPEEETAPRLLRIDEATFAGAADDAGASRCDLDGVTTATATRPTLGRRARRTLTTIHVAGGVGLLGATASTLLLALIATGSGDAAAAEETYRLISLQSAVFGIPLSMVSLLSGIALGLGTKWGVLRHWWTTLKLVLILLVMLNGALMIGASVDELRSGPSPSAETRLLIGALLNVTMLFAATTLSMFKPGGRLRRAR